MIRRCSMWLCCAAVVAAALPSGASAGTYEVRACFGDSANNSWVGWRSNGFADAYAQCPSTVNGVATEGMVARNTGGPGTAPHFSHARLTFEAPHGAQVIQVRGLTKQNSTGGWEAGLHDEVANRWAMCCSTLGTWQPFTVQLSTTKVAALAMCVRQPSCSRDRLHGVVGLRDVTVTVADDTPPSIAISGGPLVAGGWRRQVQAVTTNASDNVGIRRVRVLVDGRARGGVQHSCDPTRTLQCANGADTFSVDTRPLSDGSHVLTAEATDSAGNHMEATRRVAVDNTAPSRPSALSVDGGSGWRTANAFRLRWANPRQPAVAPIAGASIVLCPIGLVAPGIKCINLARRTGAGLSSANGIRVPGPGQWRALVSLRDAAGNQNVTHTAETTLRFDDLAPTLSFLPPSPDRPAVVRVKAQDVGSGLNVREIFLTRRGSSTSTSLPVVADKNGFSATIDDEHLRDGIYDLRARARDLAGNERSTDRRTDGKIAAVALPLRIKTSLRVGKRKRVRARGANGKRRYRIVLIEKPRSHYGRTVLLRGRLTSPGGNPLAGRSVAVYEQTQLPSAPWQPIATLRTTKTGRFTFRALRGPSRILRFRFNGSDTIRGRTAIVRMGVRAASSISVDDHRVVNGEGITFRGRLRGRPFPSSGKLIEVQARARGRWLTFGTTRARARTGRWSLPYRFSGTRGNVRYRFRVRIPKESGYPYETGISRSVTVRVQGL